MAANKAKFVGIKMPKELIGRIVEIAKAEGNPVSSVVRRLLMAAVEQEGKRL
jgi:ribbon-helix-helix CopG family protein